jgi:hypothetical protein
LIYQENIEILGLLLVQGSWVDMLHKAFFQYDLSVEKNGRLFPLFVPNQIK